MLIRLNNILKQHNCGNVIRPSPTFETARRIVRIRAMGPTYSKPTVQAAQRHGFSSRHADRWRSASRPWTLDYSAVRIRSPGLSAICTHLLGRSASQPSEHGLSARGVRPHGHRRSTTRPFDHVTRPSSLLAQRRVLPAL